MINFNSSNSADINSSFYDEQKLDFNNSNNYNSHAHQPIVQHIEQQEQHAFIPNCQGHGAGIGSDDQYNEMSNINHNSNNSNDHVTSPRNKRSILRRSHVVTPISSKSFSSKFTPNNTESVPHSHNHHHHHHNNHHHRHLGDPYENERNITENHNILLNRISTGEDNNNNHIYNSIDVTNCNNDEVNMSLNNNADQEISSERTDRLIIRKNNELDSIDYNYRIFSTNHPLRLSKIKAFEQAEAATRAFFRSQYTFDDDDSFVYASDSNSNFYDYAYQDDEEDDEEDDDDDEEVYLDEQSNRNSLIDKRLKQKRERNQNQTQRKFIHDTISNNDDNFIIQIPGLTKKETAEIFSSNNNQNNTINSQSNYEITENNNIDEFNFKLSSPEKRLRIMNNAFTKKKNCDLFTEKILSKRVEDLKLDRIFQANPSFLNELNLREIEYWSNMNEEFEKEMNEAKLNLNNNKKINNLNLNLNLNSDINDINDNDSLKITNLNNYNINSNNIESSFENEMNYEMCLKLSAQLSEELRRKIKNELNDEF
ncbi:hypothetical protein BVG19_g1662 [[Candida] boidinii]|nr:hypothetical protein BVG19_g1662 [[Candida] boidinii]OWB49965.1 hypothetical protein B5S27_g1510 [[Candida] boidinii]OWB85260.1 hypothetical protein B5S33_g3921 [[Candida] boidinii]